MRYRNVTNSSYRSFNRIYRPFWQFIFVSLLIFLNLLIFLLLFLLFFGFPYLFIQFLIYPIVNLQGKLSHFVASKLHRDRKCHIVIQFLAIQDCRTDHNKFCLHFALILKLTSLAIHQVKP